MSLNVYDVLYPLLSQELHNLEQWLKAAETHAQAHGSPVEALLTARLAPDMFDLRRQVQIASDHAKAAMVHLSGTELPRYPDEEKTTAELIARLARTRDFLDGFNREAFIGAEDRAIQLVYPWATLDFGGLHYLHYWVIPNFMFHVTTAYAILRHQGLELGKAQFLGPREGYTGAGSAAAS